MMMKTCWKFLRLERSALLAAANGASNAIRARITALEIQRRATKGTRCLLCMKYFPLVVGLVDRYLCDTKLPYEINVRDALLYHIHSSIWTCVAAHRSSSSYLYYNSW